jgi:transcriptional regulator with XRE-family HTH domain
MGTFGSRLREERVRNKLTQTALAELGGVQPNAQGHYESGQRMPRVDYLLATASVIDVTYLITGRRMAEAFAEMSQEEHDILAVLRKMPQDDKNAVGHLFRALVRHLYSGQN